jgi:hypothetical protein
VSGLYEIVHEDWDEERALRYLQIVNDRLCQVYAAECPLDDAVSLDYERMVDETFAERNWKLFVAALAGYELAMRQHFIRWAATEMSVVAAEQLALI